MQLNHVFSWGFTIRCKPGYFYFFQLASSTCEYRRSSTAFLFSLVNTPDWGPRIFRLPGRENSYNHAIYTCSSEVLRFGSGSDIYIASEASSNKNSHSYLGHTYNVPFLGSHGSTFTHSFLAGSLQFQPDEVEVFYETNYK